MRACGESPAAADASDVSVTRIRLCYVAIESAFVSSALFVNAGTAPRKRDVYVGTVSFAKSNRVILTNALGRCG